MTTLSRLRRSWRTLLLAALAGTAAGALAPPALAQRGARAAEVRGPRVLIALGPGGRDVVPLDVARTAALVRRIALDLDHVTVTEALAAIAGRSGVRLIYTEDVVPAANRVTLKAEAITTAAALTDVLLDTGVDLVFSSTGDEAVLVRRAPAARPQVGTIVGRVSDARSGDPVAGATIAIDGTRLGAVADADGRYRIANVPPGSYTLVARRIGYPPTRRAVEVTADQEVTADFALTTAPTSLEQVVVTGTAGGEQRRSIGNAVPVINAPEQRARSAAPDMGSLLNARAPGVVVAPNTGRLGAGPNIQIRGRSSMSLESSPLIYIDGVRVSNAVASGPTGSGFGSQNANIPGRLNDITPEDIDHIEVIKGPAAATLYGTEASNGVIQIITKRGAGRGKAQLSAQVQTGALWFRDPEGRIPTNFAPDGSGNIVAWNGVKTEKARGTPIFHNGQTRHYTAALSGGLDSLDYYVSTAYENDLGIESNNSLRQFASHANLTVHPNPKVDFGTSLSYIDRSSHLGADVGVSPILGAEFGHTAIFPSARGFFPNFPPEIPEQLYDNSQAINRFTGSGTVEYRPTTWFSNRLVVGIDYTGDDSRALERFAPPVLAAFLPPSVAAGRITQTLRNNTLITADYSGTARVALTRSLSAASSIGGQFYRTQLNTSTLGGMSFPGPKVETVSATAQQFNSTQTSILNTTIGAYAQEQFGWNDRLFLTAAVRVDNNSAFGNDFKWVTYPKVSGSWVVSEEPFWHVDAINTLKLRAAYGESGRQPTAFAALRTYTPVSGPDGTNGVTPGSAGNPNLKPERGKEVEVGFEGTFFGRLDLDFTYFDKRTTDEIVQQPIAPSSGFPGDQFVNLGKVTNHGIELQASVQALTGTTLAWEITANVATSRDKIVDLGGQPAIPAPGQNNIAGYPIGGYFAKRVVQADRDPATGLATNILCDGGPGQAPMACAAAPLLFIGTPTPKVSGSLANTFTIGGRLRLYAMVDFKRGHRLFNATEQLRCDGTIGIGLCEANYFPEKYSPLYLAELSASDNLAGINDQFIQDASFVKLREVSASYTLPERWLRRAGVSRAVVSVAARELHTWTRYRGVDPEVNASVSASDPLAYDQGVIPPLSHFVATLNLTF